MAVLRPNCSKPDTTCPKMAFFSGAENDVSGLNSLFLILDRKKLVIFPRYHPSLKMAGLRGGPALMVLKQKPVPLPFPVVIASPSCVYPRLNIPGQNKPEYPQ